jgi:hypothetical protein
MRHRDAAIRALGLFTADKARVPAPHRQGGPGQEIERLGLTRLPGAQSTRRHSERRRRTSYPSGSVLDGDTFRPEAGSARPTSTMTSPCQEAGGCLLSTLSAKGEDGDEAIGNRPPVGS